MRRIAIMVSLAAGSVLVLATSPAGAHQHRHVGGIETTVGWGEEPAFAGFKNSITFRAARPAPGAQSDEESGTPVAGATLQVEVIFGGPTGSEKIGPLDLEPAFGDAGLYETALIPTRPGTYTFHVTGKLAGKNFDQTYTSGDGGKNAQSEGTFDDVEETSDIKFPVKDPNPADLAGRITQEAKRLSSRTAAVKDDASMATTLGYVGIGLGALALIIALVRRRSPKA
jgi:hypothetical protein